MWLFNNSVERKTFRSLEGYHEVFKLEGVDIEIENYYFDNPIEVWQLSKDKYCCLNSDAIILVAKIYDYPIIVHLKQFSDLLSAIRDEFNISIGEIQQLAEIRQSKASKYVLGDSKPSSFEEEIRILRCFTKFFINPDGFERENMTVGQKRVASYCKTILGIRENLDGTHRDSDHIVLGADYDKAIEKIYSVRNDHLNYINSLSNEALEFILSHRLQFFGLKAYEVIIYFECSKLYKWGKGIDSLDTFWSKISEKASTVLFPNDFESNIGDDDFKIFLDRIGLSNMFSIIENFWWNDSVAHSNKDMQQHRKLIFAVEELIFSLHDIVMNGIHSATSFYNFEKIVDLLLHFRAKDWYMYALVKLFDIQYGESKTYEFIIEVKKELEAKY